MKTAAPYHRVSTIDQDQSLATEELRVAATTRGYIVDLEVEETGSGARNDRPGLQRVLAAASKGKINAVFVYKLDRFGRSSLDVLNNIRALESAGVEFIVTSQGLHIRPDGDAVSKLLLGMLASVAEFERTLIIERTRLGLAKARSKGTKFGRPRARNAPCSRTVTTLRDQGLTWSRIVKDCRCTIAAARRAADRAAEMGPADPRVELPDPA